MSLLLIASGKIVQSLQAPIHNSGIHTGNALVLEEYSNHLGAIDNFTQTNVTGNGTATSDATNHEMDLSTGISLAGHARFTLKKTITLSASRIAMEFIVRNIVIGIGSNFKVTAVGLFQLSGESFTKMGCFVQKNDGSWQTTTTEGTATQNYPVTINNGDILGIIASTGSISYFINGIEQVKHDSYLPDTVLNIGVIVMAQDANVSTARSLSVDFMGFKHL